MGAAPYEGYSNHRAGFNLVAKPGRSPHQSGIDFDIALAGATEPRL
jgi:hypothetical protein